MTGKPDDARRVSWLALSISVLLAATLGAVGAYYLGAMQAKNSLQDNGKGSTATAPSGPEAPRSDADLLAQFRQIDWNVPQPQVGEAIAVQVARSGALRSEILQRFEQEGSKGREMARGNLLQLLTAKPHPEVAATALAWATQTDSVEKRGNGFTLLARLPPSKQMYRLARQALTSEKESATLAAALWALQPTDIPEPSEVRHVVPLLHSLTRHASPEVRVASIQLLAQWDRARIFVEADARRLLTDSDRDVRVAAIGAGSVAALVSEGTKADLFKILRNAKEDDEVRDTGLMQMDRFGLSDQEYATVMAVRAELMAKGKANDTQRGK